MKILLSTFLAIVFLLDSGRSSAHANVVETQNTESSAQTSFTPLIPSGQIHVGRCYMGSCSWTKWLSVRTISSMNGVLLLEATILGGTSSHPKKYPDVRAGEKVPIEWNDAPHNFIAICSRSNPTIIIGDQITRLPLNAASGVPGFLETDAGGYFAVCHSHFDGYSEGIEKYGYDVHVDE